jgi:hypothetical protein
VAHHLVDVDRPSRADVEVVAADRHAQLTLDARVLLVQCRTALEDFGYALSSGSLESIPSACAFVTGRSVDPRHALELGVAVGTAVPVLVTEEVSSEGSDPIAMLCAQNTLMYECVGGCDTIIAVLQLVRRRNAAAALRRLTEVVEAALRDGQKPEPACPLLEYMRPASSIAKAALQQQRLACMAPRKGRGTRLAWRMITTYADRRYKKQLERPANKAQADFATEEDLLRAFCLARA